MDDATRGLHRCITRPWSGAGPEVHEDREDDQGSHNARDGEHRPEPTRASTGHMLSATIQWAGGALRACAVFTPRGRWRTGLKSIWLLLRTVCNWRPIASVIGACREQGIEVYLPLIAVLWLAIHRYHLGVSGAGRPVDTHLSSLCAASSLNRLSPIESWSRRSRGGSPPAPRAVGAT